MQLVGLTAFFFVCKYEEIYPPEIQDFIRTRDAYSNSEIIEVKKTVLNALDFKLFYPLSLHFLWRFSKAACTCPKIHTLEYECASWNSPRS